jgi:hypothetical protein
MRRRRIRARRLSREREMAVRRMGEEAGSGVGYGSPEIIVRCKSMNIVIAVVEPMGPGGVRTIP